MTTGTDLMHRIMLAIGSLPGVRTFRHNVALAWVGNGPPLFNRSGRPKTVLLHPGDAVIRQARPLHAGLVKGGFDLLGWTSVEIQPHHVGRKVAVFTAIEAKDGAGRLEKDQVRFGKAVAAAGGIASEARSEEEALSVIERGIG